MTTKSTTRPQSLLDAAATRLFPAISGSYAGALVYLLVSAVMGSPVTPLAIFAFTCVLALALVAGKIGFEYSSARPALVTMTVSALLVVTAASLS